MSMYTCKDCHKSFQNYQDLQHIDSIIEKGVCCTCREDAAFCTECNTYHFGKEAYMIVKNESELCVDHYQQLFEQMNDLLVFK